MQGGKRQGVGNGLAEPGEVGLVWVMKGLEKFGHYSALSGSHSCLSNGISFYMKSYAEFQTTKKNDKGRADLAKAGGVPEHCPLKPHSYSAPWSCQKGREPWGAMEHSLKTTGRLWGPSSELQ